MFHNGGIKMWLYVIILPAGILYYITNCIIIIFLSSRSKTEENIFGTRKLPNHSRHGFIYLTSLFAEIIYTVFFICFVIMNWYKIIWAFSDIAAAGNISSEMVSSSFTLYPGLGTFFYVTLGLIILNTLFFKFYFRYSK
tara:strand:- start:296 stop:712 length:417 start_codon:yes stop_codon:yes gene_type:complete